jgi:hypothetical protein
MSRSQKTEVIDPKGKEIWAACGFCGKVTAHSALVEVDVVDGDDSFTARSENFIIMCLGCKTVSFCEESSNSEDIDYNDEGEPVSHTITQKVYPGRVAGRSLLEDIHRLPNEVRLIYLQTHEAICNKQSILAGIGLRAIVEAVCSEKEASGRNLLKKIDSLVRKGVTTRDGADILHSIRHMGNTAAHKVSANTEEELTTALEVVEHLLMGVYLIPHKAQKLKKP